MSNQEDQDKLGPHQRKGDDRRKRGQDRRRANQGRGPDGFDRRKNPGDRRRVLGDRRNVRRPPEGPANYDLRVQDSDDWDKWVHDLGDQKPAS